MSNAIGARAPKNIPQFNSVLSSAKVAPATDKLVDGQSPEIKEGPALAKPAAGSTPEKPSLTMSSKLKEVGLFLKSALTPLVLGMVAVAVAIPTAVVAGVVMAGGALASAAGSTSSFAAGSRSILSSLPSALGKTKAPKEQADGATIDKHKVSTESQLTVALENFKLAATKLGIPKEMIGSKAEELKQTIEGDIAKKYTKDCDLNSVNKEFRDKHDDFGLTAELGQFLLSTSADKGARTCKAEAEAESAMKETKPAAIDTVGQTKAKKGFSSDIKVGESTYKTEIKMQTTGFVSSASSEHNGNICGNLNLQTLTGQDGTVLFKTLRHAALTAKPDPTTTNDPFSKGEPKETAASKAKSLCENLNSGDTKKVGAATQELKKYGIEASDFKGFLSGKIDESKLTKKMAKQCGLLNKALDVGKAAWAAQGSPSGTVNITSLSLMTPDRPRAIEFGTISGGEIGKLKDQVEAFKLLQSLGSEDLVGMGIGSAKTPVTFNVMTFNFGVNEGESLGRGLQKEYNEAAMGKLMTISTSKLADLSNAIQKTTKGSPEFAKLFVQIETIQALGKDIGELHAAYTAPPSDTTKGLWRADQAYNLTAKIAFLTELCDGANTCNCASGKDRTGMHVQNSLNYAGLMRDRMDGRMGDLKYEKMSNQNQIKHLDAHHFDVLEAVAKESFVNEVTDFITCIKNGASLTASDLKPFLKDGGKELNLSMAQQEKFVAIDTKLSKEPPTTLSELDLHTLAEIKNDLLFSGQGALSSQTSFMEKALFKFGEKNGSSSMGVKSTWEMIIDPKTSASDKAGLQARNKEFMTGTGQHNVQEWNTGSPGYKLYEDTAPNLITNGGQTQSYFMTMFGGTKADVANTVTMQAKFNAT